MTRIAIGNIPTPSASPWNQFGFLENPFPASGVAANVNYDIHQPEVVAMLNAWLTKSVDQNALIGLH